MQEDLDSVSAVLRALGHPTRLGIARRLAVEGEICACDFTEHFGVSQPTISGHLKALRTNRVVRTRRRGTQICYSLAPNVAGLLGELAETLNTAPQTTLRR
jgi:ArsR family transcriptional regulator, arsenate/arsenite/antimonite-responsive transcriptional repressor